MVQEASIAIVVSSDQKILWVKRRDLPVWVLPGGGVDPGEKPEKAAIREVYEESGLHVEILRKGAFLHPKNSLSGLTHIYVCKPTGGKTAPQEESIAVEWFPILSPPNPHFPLHPIWVNEVLSNPDKVIERQITEITISRVLRFAISHPWILLKYLWGR